MVLLLVLAVAVGAYALVARKSQRKEQLNDSRPDALKLTSAFSVSAPAKVGISASAISVGVIVVVGVIAVLMYSNSQRHAQRLAHDNMVDQKFNAMIRQLSVW